MWYGGNSFHNAVTARNASFARFLPKLMVKFIRVPAMFGGLAVGAFAWVQYQAARMFGLSMFNLLPIRLLTRSCRGRNFCHQYLQHHQGYRFQYCLNAIRRG